MDLGSIQDIFDKSSRHLLNQAARAVEKEKSGGMLVNGACRYRSSDGLMCAVGCLIPDELYDPSFEGLGFGSNNELHAMFGIDPDSPKRLLLMRLQKIHDESQPESWPELLNELAVTFGLGTYTVEEAPTE